MNYYDYASLSRALNLLEKRHGLASEDFYRLHASDDPSVAHIRGFTRHIWADLYLDSCRISQPGVAA